MDYSANSRFSERNVVFHIVELAGRLLGRAAGFRRCAALRRMIAVGFAAGLARAGSRTEHLHAIGADFGAVAVLAGLLVLVLARAQLPLDVDLRALLQVFAGDLGELAEEADAVPLGGLLLFAARLVLPGLRGGDADVGDCLAARQVARLRVPPEIANDDYLVYRCHVPPILVQARCLSPNADPGTPLTAAFKGVGRGRVKEL